MSNKTTRYGGRKNLLVRNQLDFGVSREHSVVSQPGKKQNLFGPSLRWFKKEFGLLYKLMFLKFTLLFTVLFVLFAIDLKITAALVSLVPALALNRLFWPQARKWWHEFRLRRQSKQSTDAFIRN